MSRSIDTKHKSSESVTNIEITVGDEKVVHHFGRRVPMTHARIVAQAYLDLLTGQPTNLTANQPEVKRDA